MLTAVVLHKNHHDRLRYLMLKLQCLQYQVNRSELEILVVDYSDDASAADYCKEKKVRCLKVQGEFNISEARNIGIRHASHEWVCISGNDTLVDRNYFAKLCGLIHAYQGQKVFFIGNFINLIKRANTPTQNKLLNATYVIHGFLQKVLDSQNAGDKLPSFYSRLLYNHLFTTARNDSIRKVSPFSLFRWLRKSARLVLSSRMIEFGVSFGLLRHLLQEADNPSGGLMLFHDSIFSTSFLRNKLIRPGTFHCFSRQMAEEINGYDESFTGWGAEDTDFIFRAQHQGYQLVNTHLISVHLDHEIDWSQRRAQRKENIRLMESRHSLVQPQWGLGAVRQEA